MNAHRGKQNTKFVPIPQQQKIPVPKLYYNTILMQTTHTKTNTRQNNYTYWQANKNCILMPTGDEKIYYTPKD